MEGTGFKPSITLLWKGLSAIADERCRTDKLDGVIKHRSSRETTMVGRGASPVSYTHLTLPTKA